MHLMVPRPTRIILVCFLSHDGDPLSGDVAGEVELKHESPMLQRGIRPLDYMAKQHMCGETCKMCAQDVKN